MMFSLKTKLFPLAIFTVMLFNGCGKNFNIFSIEQEVQLGQQVAQQIESDPKQFPILPESSNREVYRYIRRMRDRILQSGKVAYRSQFAWEVKIIDDDKTLNAFATPGGYIYVYTGLIKFLDSEDQLAGVMGHEIAHAALRHSTRQMTKIYGLSALVSIATGNPDPGLVEQVALGLLSLRFSRSHETEADTYSVVYLCETDYNAAGAAGFFQKVQGKETPPEFLSTHPDPGNRVQNIQNKEDELGCKGNHTYDSEYARIKRLLD